VRVDRLDHLVLTVASIEATVGFYTRVLGMEAVTFGPGRTALTFGTSKINLHQAGREFEPKALRPADRRAWSAVRWPTCETSRSVCGGCQVLRGRYIPRTDLCAR